MEIERSVIDDDKVLIKKLKAIIRIEAEKPIEEMDVDLIDECVDFLMELEGSEALTEEQIEKGVNEILEEVEAKRHGRKKFRFKAILAAACLAVILLVGNIAAMSFGIDTLSVYKQLGSSISSMLSGESVDYSGITIIKENQAVNYKTINDFLKSDDADGILYPTNLPDDLKIKKVAVTDYCENNAGGKVPCKNIFYVTNDKDTSIIAHTDPDFLDNYISAQDIYKSKIGEYVCYVKFSNSDKEQIAFIHNEITYVIKAPSYENAVMIIKNLKEYKK